ncbi:MAG: chromosome segregation protein SMC [Myxococcales bacterium FL481]|nr:MAG: chromosome segregation protein SMC [Myxococcales bacterium FL481]
MRIKKIEINGFKSFADRQVFHIDGCVTGVIGPNGCGKSNIVDAIRWCLGEQRARHLRGSGMSDVIFAGTKTRGQAASAEVTITFENDGDVPPPWGRFETIAIARRLYRDGTSEYLINKVPARLRDITDLLTGTGVGARGYSIIEQGQVGTLVTSKPETRRLVIDEAAGITKFKSQKAAAERKIEQTRQNLLRTSDVISELEGRIGTLRRQAQKAERYRRYRDEQRDLELWIAAHKYLELASTGRVLTERRTELDEQVGALRHETVALEAKGQADRLALTELADSLTKAQQRSFDLENQIKLLEQDRRFHGQEIDANRQAIESAETESEVVRRSLAALEEEQAAAKAEEAALDEAGSGGERADNIATLEQDYADKAAALEQETRRREGLRGDHSRAASERAGLDARVESLLEAIAEHDRQLTLLRDEQREQQAAGERTRSEVEAANSALTARESAAAEVRERRQALVRERVVLRDEVERGDVEVETARKELVRARSRLQSLEEIQERYRGCASGVQVVMEHRAKLVESRVDGSVEPSAAEPVFGIMADFVDAPPHLEHAVAAVLGDRLQGVVVDEPRTGVQGIELLKELREGRTTFLPAACPSPQSSEAGTGASGSTGGDAGPVMGWAAPHRPQARGIELVDLTPTANQPAAGAEDKSVLAAEGVLGRMRDLVAVDARVSPLAEVLLRDTLVVKDLSRALELWQGGRARHTFVTLDGDRVEPSGVVVGGSSEALDSALLQQKREIRELGQVVTELEGELERVKNKRQGMAERLAAVEGEREQNEQDLLAVERAHIEAKQAVETATATRQRVEQRAAELSRQLESVSGQLERRRSERAECEAKRAALDERSPELAREIEASEGQSEQLTVDRDGLAAQLTEAKVELARWQQQRDAVVQTRQRLDKQVASERDRVRRLEAATEQARARVEELEAKVVEMVQSHRDLLEEHDQAATAKHDAIEAHDAARLRLDELEASLRNLRQDLERERDRLAEVELGVRELDLERGHLEADIRERFDREIPDVLIDFHARPLAGSAEHERRAELKRVLSRMGEVNLTAIEEFDEVSQRYDYLCAQKGDLEDAIAQLQEAIEKINATTRERFAATFRAVNEHFQVLFPRLFNGGRAELVMTDPSDLLATGVEVMAQPPGKRVASLELLSGGEKALTAVSLIFAIFLTKPSPFCLLDEVDAPLDESNVGRLTDLVRELSEGTQFIVITHNKRTMEAADRLYGVTMEQKGVSKLVSVNLRKTAAAVHYVQ